MQQATIASKIFSLLLIGGTIAVVGVPRPLLMKHALKNPATVEVKGSSPQLCIGFNSSTGIWGEEYQVCAPGYAAYGVADAGGKERAGEKIPAVQNCCPLPAPDILTQEEVYVRESCPENYVATGSKLDFSKGDDGIQFMRCTKINAARYKLGAPKPSLYFGNGFAGWQGSQRIEREDIPAALRWGMSRMSRDKWNKEGCIGFPFGSLLTSKQAKVCAGFAFRELEFAGLPGDPAAGTPVKMFPDCSDVTRLDDPQRATCVKG